MNGLGIRSVVLVIAIIFVGISISNAKEIGTRDIISAYRQYKEIKISDSVPKVVEVDLTDEFFERQEFAVLDVANDVFEPYLFRDTTSTTPLSINANNTFGNAGNMVDGDNRSYAEFILPEDGIGSARVTLTTQEPITSSSLSILLDNYVTLPNSIEVRVVVGGVEKTIVAQRRMTGQVVNFPETISNTWIIDMTYSQLLRISELRLLQKNAGYDSSQWVRFLAQPEHEYRVYFNPDRSTDIDAGELPNLDGDDGVVRISAPSLQNVEYTQADIDGDTIPDVLDNCISVYNPAQEDIDENGRGDVCDDFDKDGIINSVDNCPNHPNRNQYDRDGDAVGDECDNEESRVTEKYPWLPWLGIFCSIFVIVVLFILTMRSKK